MRVAQIYRAVDAVARYGSIRRAAASISLSPSALNRQILALEDEIGAPLFERLPRGVRLSTAGEIYLRFFRNHLSDLDRAASQVADLYGFRSGTIRIGVGEELASAFLPAILSRHMEQFPLIDVAVETVAYDDVGRALGDYEIDLALCANPLLDEAVETIITEESAVVGLTRSGPITTAPLRLSDLAGVPLVVPTRRSGVRHALDAAFTARSTPRRVVCVADRVSPEVLGASEGAIQVVLDVDVDTSALEALGLRCLRFEPRAFGPVYVHLMRARGRTLPVAPAKFAEDVTRLLAMWSNADAASD